MRLLPDALCADDLAVFRRDDRAVDARLVH